MSEADKIIKSLRDSGKKVEEFYMSNKTSDKNVANDIKILKKFCEYEEAVVLTDNALEEVQDAMQNILAEREQKDKRIQELEEESRKKSIGLICYQEELENSISTQVVIDKIKELDVAILECEYDDDDVEEYKNDVEKEKRILLIKKSALEELLEEK